MTRPTFEVADIIRAQGNRFLEQNRRAAARRSMCVCTAKDGSQVRVNSNSTASLIVREVLISPLRPLLRSAKWHYFSTKLAV